MWWPRVLKVKYIGISSKYLLQEKLQKISKNKFVTNKIILLLLTKVQFLQTWLRDGWIKGNLVSKNSALIFCWSVKLAAVAMASSASILYCSTVSCRKINFLDLEIFQFQFDHLFMLSLPNTCSIHY